MFAHLIMDTQLLLVIDVTKFNAPARESVVTEHIYTRHHLINSKQSICQILCCDMCIFEISILL